MYGHGAGEVTGRLTVCRHGAGCLLSLASDMMEMGSLLLRLILVFRFFIMTHTVSSIWNISG